MAVVSDLATGRSHIFSGRFGCEIGITADSEIDSIWEREVLSRMNDDDLEHKYVSELRFWAFLRHLPRRSRRDYCLMARLSMMSVSGYAVDVLHRMYYVYAPDGDGVCYAVCLYGPLVSDVGCGAMAVNLVSGERVMLTGADDGEILTRRERQVLSMVDKGMSSDAIAAELCISRHTVSRHRQAILSKLQVRNSPEACRRAKSLSLI